MPEPLFLVSLWVLFGAGYLLFVRKGTAHRNGVGILLQEAARETSWIHDRRRYKRRYLPFPVDYGSLAQADSQGVTLTEDVGKGGVRFPSRYPLRPGSRLHLSVVFPWEKPLSLFGEVVWQRPHPAQASRFETGIRFVDISPAKALKIARYL